MCCLLDDEVLHGLDEPTLDVSSAGGLDSRINQPLPTSHGMEEQLLGSQTNEITILHKPSGLWPQVILGKVRQGTTAEAKRNALAFHILLAHACHHLRSVLAVGKIQMRTQVATGLIMAVSCGATTLAHVKKPWNLVHKTSRDAWDLQPQSTASHRPLHCCVPATSLRNYLSCSSRNRNHEGKQPRKPSCVETIRSCPATKAHLRDVDEGALGPSLDHTDNIVGLLQADLSGLSSIITSLVQGHVDLPLKGLHHGTASLRLKVIDLGFGYQLAHLHLGLQCTMNRVKILAFMLKPEAGAPEI